MGKEKERHQQEKLESGQYKMIDGQLYKKY